MITQKERELLEMTGGVWIVTCYADANQRKRYQSKYVRASSREKACEVGIELTRGILPYAIPWDPAVNGCHGYIREVQP
jgi:hypothetical protein